MIVVKEEMDNLSLRRSYGRIVGSVAIKFESAWFRMLDVCKEKFS